MCGLFCWLEVGRAAGHKSEGAIDESEPEVPPLVRNQ
jgi:hypothetical protein